jgi:hypothetical protein
MVQTFSHGYALLIGVGAAAYAPWSLPVTVKDVQAVRSVLTDPALCGYSDDDQHVRLLHDHSATRAAKEHLARSSEADGFIIMNPFRQWRTAKTT